MTQLHEAKQDARKLRSYLFTAGEIGFRAYLAACIGALRDRARETKSPLDDVLIIVLSVAADRLFPPQTPPDDQSANLP